MPAPGSDNEAPETTRARVPSSDAAELAARAAAPVIVPGRLLTFLSSAERKNYPLCEGCLDYFPDALAAVANISKKGNDKHNPGQPLHHARGKSNDHADCIMRHLMERGGVDPEGNRHSAQLAWRALALLQEELEREKALSLPRNATAPGVELQPR